METYDVFLSHSSMDKPWVTQLAADLQRHNVRVWLDQAEMRPGETLVQALEAGLAQCRTVVLVVTPEALASPWVREEYHTAMTMAVAQDKRLIPALLRQAEMPGFLASRLWVDFRDPATYATQVKRLVHGIMDPDPAARRHLQAPLSPAPRATGRRTGGVTARNITTHKVVTGAEVHSTDADTIHAVAGLTQSMQTGGVEAETLHATEIIDGVKVVPPDVLEAERGWRYVTRVLPNGRKVRERVMLTDADMLDPQEGDIVPQRPEHAQVVHDLFSMLTTHFAPGGRYSVFHDFQMDWGIPGLGRPSPDIAVVPDVRDPATLQSQGMFDVSSQGTRPVLAIEVISPTYITADTHPNYKRRIYAQAGVQEYVILDPGGYTRTPVVGYRLGSNQHYDLIPVDAAGRVHCTSVGLYFVLDGKQVVAIDAATDVPLLTHKDQVARAEAAEQARVQAEHARTQAENRAETEAQARAAAEAEIARLQAELQRLRGSA